MGAFILQDAFDSEHKPFVTVWQGRDFKERRLLFVCSSHGIHGSMWIEHWLTGLKNLRLMSSCSLYDGRNDATSPKKRTVVKTTSQFCLGQKITNTSLCSVFYMKKEHRPSPHFQWLLFLVRIASASLLDCIRQLILSSHDHHAKSFTLLSV